MILAHTFPVSVLRVESVINQDLRALIPRTAINPQFLAYCLRAQAGYALQQVSTAAHGTKRFETEGLRKLFALDPGMPLQQEFAKRVAAVEQLRSAHRASLGELDALFAALQDRAFRGEL